MTALSELDILIGGVLITGFEGLEVGADFEDHYLKCPSGGFILFGRNAGSAAQAQWCRPVPQGYPAVARTDGQLSV